MKQSLEQSIYKVLRSQTRATASSPVHPPQCMDTFSPLPTPTPLSSSPPFCFKHSFASTLWLPLLPRRYSIFQVAYIHDTQTSACTKKTNIPQVCTRGEAKHSALKEYTLIPVHTAHTALTHGYISNGTFSTVNIHVSRSLNSLGGLPLEISPTALTTSLQITAHNPITHANL